MGNPKPTSYNTFSQEPLFVEDSINGGEEAPVWQRVLAKFSRWLTTTCYPEDESSLDTVVVHGRLIVVGAGATSSTSRQEVLRAAAAAEEIVFQPASGFSLTR